jgi:glutaredoxin 2
MLHLAKLPFENIVLLNDDEGTPIKMIGKKQLPILQKENGEYISESLDIVEFLDKNLNILGGKRDANIELWTNDSSNYLFKLIFPRVVKIGLPEFATESAIKYFQERKEALIGMTFEEALKETDELKMEAEYHLKLLSPLLQKLPSLKNKDFSLDDIILFPIFFICKTIQIMTINRAHNGKSIK